MGNSEVIRRTEYVTKKKMKIHYDKLMDCMPDRVVERNITRKKNVMKHYGNKSVNWKINIIRSKMQYYNNEILLRMHEDKLLPCRVRWKKRKLMLPTNKEIFKLYTSV